MSPNMVNFSLLAAEIVSLLWGTPVNFNNFRVLASLLQRRRSTEANQTLHNVWPLPGLVDCAYIFGGCCSVTEFWQVQNSLCVLQVLRCPIGSVTARQSSSGREPNFAALSTRRHLYSAGRPSRWALAHVLVSTGFASWQRYCTALYSGRQPNSAALNRGRHLYSAGRPSRWTLVHIIVLILSLFLTIARDHFANRLMSSPPR